jgi:hypothetical protein
MTDIRFLARPLKRTALVGASALLLCSPNSGSIAATPLIPAFMMCSGGLCYYHGGYFKLSPSGPAVTLFDLKASCENLQPYKHPWHLALEQELEPQLRFLAHGTGMWSDFSRIDLNGPGYILVTGNASMAFEYAADRKSITVDVYRLNGNAGFPALSTLGLTAIHAVGPSIDRAPLTDNAGDESFVKFICVTGSY